MGGIGASHQPATNGQRPSRPQLRWSYRLLTITSGRRMRYACTAAAV